MFFSLLLCCFGFSCLALFWCSLLFFWCAFLGFAYYTRWSSKATRLTFFNLAKIGLFKGKNLFLLLLLVLPKNIVFFFFDVFVWSKMPLTFLRLAFFYPLGFLGLANPRARPTQEQAQTSQKLPSNSQTGPNINRKTNSQSTNQSLNQSCQTQTHLPRGKKDTKTKTTKQRPTQHFFF